MVAVPTPPPSFLPNVEAEALPCLLFSRSRFFQRLSSLSHSTAVCQARFASFGRIARGLEYLHGVLSVSPPRRLWLCALCLRRLSVTWQIVLQIVILVVAFALLPIHLGNESPPTATTPIFWLLKILAVAVGLPFVVLATTAPLLQRWYARLAPHRDPYVLYSASNAGSLLALLAYPVAIEPVWTLGSQSGGWRWGFAALWPLRRCLRHRLMAASGPVGRRRFRGASLRRARAAWRRRLFWLLLAFVPSSLLLSVTTYLTTDLAAIPLLWIIPLALYLLTFVIAFARRPGAQPFFLARGCRWFC